MGKNGLTYWRKGFSNKAENNQRSTRASSLRTVLSLLYMLTMPFWYILTRRLLTLQLNPYKRATIWPMMETSRITLELVSLSFLTYQLNCINRAWLNMFFKLLASMKYRITPKCMTRKLSALIRWITIQMLRLVSAIGTIIQWSERSVMSNKWSVPILPLRSNS